MENKEISYKKISTFYLFGTLFNKGIAFITVPIFTRLLSVSDYGTVTTYNSWLGIVLIIISMALYMGLRVAFVDYRDSVEDFCASITTFNLLFGGCLIIVATGLLLSGANVPGRSMILCCLVQSTFTAIIENYSMYLMMNYSYKLRTAFMVLPNLVSTLIVIPLLVVGTSAEPYMVKIVVTVIITGLFGILALKGIYSKAKTIWKKEYVLCCLKVSLPLVFHGISLNILSQSDRTMITLIRGEEETGIYGLIYNFSMLSAVLTTALEGIWVPWFTAKMNDKDYDEINEKVKKYILFMTVAMIGIVLVGPEIVKILAPQEYWDGISIIPPLVLSNYLIFLYTLFVNIEHYYKKTLFISINTAISAVSNIVLNVFFIHMMGYKGAAYTTLFSYLLALILHMSYAKKLNNKLYSFRIFVPSLLMVFVFVLLFYIFSDYWIIRWILALVFASAMIVKERESLCAFLRR